MHKLIGILFHNQGSLSKQYGKKYLLAKPIWVFMHKNERKYMETLTKNYRKTLKIVNTIYPNSERKNINVKMTILSKRS